MITNFKKLLFLFLISITFNVSAERDFKSVVPGNLSTGLEVESTMVTAPSDNNFIASSNFRSLLSLEYGDKISKRLINGEKFILLTSVSSGAKILLPLKSSNYLKYNDTLFTPHSCNCDPSTLEFEGINFGITGILDIKDNVDIIFNSNNSLGNSTYFISKKPSPFLGPIPSLEGAPSSIPEGGINMSTPEDPDENLNTNPYQSPGTTYNPYDYQGVGANIPLELLNFWHNPQLLEDSKVLSTENGVTIVFGKENKVILRFVGVLDIRSYNLIEPNQMFTFLGPRLSLGINLKDKIIGDLSFQHQQSLQKTRNGLQMSESKLELGIEKSRARFNINTNIKQFKSTSSPTYYSPSINAGFNIKF